MTEPWTGREASASGQVFEFRLWALLTEQSRGGLHVFLPLADRGIDALVHRLSDGAYQPVQAKARSVLIVAPAPADLERLTLAVAGLRELVNSPIALIDRAAALLQGEAPKLI